MLDSAIVYACNDRLLNVYKELYYCINIGELRGCRGFGRRVRVIPGSVELYNKMIIIIIIHLKIARKLLEFFS